MRNDRVGLINSRSLSRTSWKQKIRVILAKGRRRADSSWAGIQWYPRKDLDSSLHGNDAQKRPC